MFIDKVRISVKAGAGGNGAVAFHREKYVAAGGPDGGDGGNGGSIVLRVDDNLSTLMDFRYKRKYTAPNGENGQGKRCRGKNGENLIIKVPRGTVVRDLATNEIIKDMSDSDDFVLCKGGRGGWGNQHFATPTRQVPRFAKAGLPGEEHDVILELKLLADVGLVGFPNVGKSTLLSVTSNAHPKIANYHFTTLYPNLGVIYVADGVSFVMADIPGIIEGAADGVGLGHDFLRHIDRCRLLVHIVDVSGSEDRDPVDDFEKINEELRQYSPELAERPMLVAANKVDLLPPDSDNLERLRAHVEAKGYEFYTICAATTQGTRELMKTIAGKLAALPPVTIYEPEYVKPLAEAGDADELQIERYDDLWVVSGKWLQKLLNDINFDSGKTVVHLTGANKGEVDTTGMYTSTASNKDQTLTFYNFKENMDDIYTLTAETTDKAGNQYSTSKIFSVNRDGSTYLYDDYTEELIKNGYTNDPKNLVVSEINVDTLTFWELMVSENGTQKTLEQNKDFEVSESGSDVSWKEYKYTINASNFENEGDYNVSIYSEDRATNVTTQLSPKTSSLQWIRLHRLSPWLTSKTVEDTK